MVGFQYYSQERWEDSLEWFRRALRLHDGYIVAWYRAAYAVHRLGKDDESIGCLQRCIDSYGRLEGDAQLRERKTYGKAQSLLGKIYVSQGLHLKAHRPLEVAVEVDGRNSDRRYQLGKCLLLKGEAEHALTHLEQANRLKPRTDYIIDRLAQANMKCGNLDKALRLYESIHPKRRKPYILKNLGALHLERGEPEKASAVLSQAVRGDSANHNAHFLLGQAAEASGRFAEAVRAFERAIELKQKNYDRPFPDAQERLEAIRERHAEADLEPRDEEEPQQALEEGTIKFYNRSRAFGFIDASNASVFFHKSVVTDPSLLNEGTRVAFTATDSEKGRRATLVTNL
jgi:tetratricopeptide (TPR) repeat protein